MAAKAPGSPLPQFVRLLDADPDLGDGLAPEEVEVARRYAVCETATVGCGLHDPWLVGSDQLLGLLVIDGLLIRSVQVAERRCGELVGPGAILRPWDHFGQYAPLPFEVSWRVVKPVKLAMLDQRLVTVSARWPSLMNAIIRRAVGRSHALALNVAIHSLQHVELRLLVLFWHLADRFGHVTAAGTVVPLELSHEDLAELVGAQRPSVSARLSALSVRGELVRLPDRTWLLPGDPPAELRDTRAGARAIMLHQRQHGTRGQARASGTVIGPSADREREHGDGVGDVDGSTPLTRPVEGSKRQRGAFRDMPEPENSHHEAG